MTVFFLLNGRAYHIPFTAFYAPVLLIDMRDETVQCGMQNQFLFYIENPRVNIRLLSGSFDFYFRDPPEEFTLGQIMSKILVSYRSLDSVWELTDPIRIAHEYMPCVLFTKGFRLEEMLIYMPVQKHVFLRELKYHFFPRIYTTCAVCLEEKYNAVNLHPGKSYAHHLCLSCVLRLSDPICPLCRQSIT